MTVVDVDLAAMATRAKQIHEMPVDAQLTSATRFNTTLHDLGPMEVSPKLLFGWLNDRIASYESKLWWNNLAIQEVNHFQPLLATYQAIGRLEAKGSLTFLGGDEISSLKSALNQLAIGIAVRIACRNQPQLLDSIQETLLLHYGFTYFSAGWHGSAEDAGHVMMAKIVKQPGTNLFTVYLFNTGPGLERHKLVSISPTWHGQYCSYVKYENLGIENLRHVHFFQIPTTQKQPLDIIYGSYVQTVDSSRDIPMHLRIRAPLSMAHPISIIRLLLRENLASIPKARLLRFEITSEFIKTFKETHNLKYSAFHDMWRVYLQEAANYFEAKLQRQIAECKSEEEFRWMLRIVQIYREDIFNLDNKQHFIWESKQFYISDYGRRTFRIAHASPVHPSGIPNADLRLPTPLYLQFVAQWKGFNYLPVGVIPRTHYDLDNDKDAQAAMNLLIEHFSVPLLTLFGPDSIRKLLWHPTIQVHDDNIQITESLGWLEWIVSNGCDAELGLFSPHTITILRSIIFWNYYLDFNGDKMRLEAIQKAFSTLMNSSPTIRVCSLTLPNGLRTALKLI